MANIEEIPSEVFKILQHRNFPNGVKFEVFEDIYSRSLRFDCSSCREIGLVFRKDFSLHDFMVCRHKEEFFEMVIREIHRHALLHNEIVQMLSEKYDFKRLNKRHNKNESKEDNWRKVEPSLRRITL